MNTTTTVPIDSIIIKRTKRQRRVLPPDDNLAESIATHGLLQPIVITSTDPPVLVAGERRLEAVRSLGWTAINCTVITELSEHKRHEVELEENIRRAELSWQDECLAVADYHDLRGEASTHEESAASLFISESNLRARLIVAEALRGPNGATIARCEGYTAALNMAGRYRERARQAASTRAESSIDSIGEAADDVLPSSDVPIYHADFSAWTAPLSAPKFNFIHCDFPYGTDTLATAGGLMNRAQYRVYDDSAEVGVKLLDALDRAMSTLVAADAHLMFWFDIQAYTEVKAALEHMGWWVAPRPLVWSKVNTGVLSDPNRLPRHVYEAAFLGIRGGRPIVKAVPNAYAGSPDIQGRVHPSEKDLRALVHFFQLFVDSSTDMLDPTCGSGNAVNAALACGARSAIGLEVDEEFYRAAVAKFEATKLFREGSHNG